MEAQFWLNLQLAWDLYHVEHSYDVEIGHLMAEAPYFKATPMPNSA